MIYLNNKISTTNNKSVQQNTNQRKFLVSKNSIEQDTISFSGIQETPNKKEDKNKITAYIIAGIAIIVGGIILALNLKKGKNPLKNSGENIAEGAQKANKGTSSNINSSEGSSKRQYSAVSSPSSQPSVKSTAPKQNEELINAQKEKAELEKQIKEQQAGAEQSKKDLEKRLDGFIEKINPNDKKIAKEALPQLINHSEKLGIGIEDFNPYLNYITLENKDFAITEGIPLIANNIELIKKVIPESEYSDIPKLLKYLNAKNNNEFKSLLEKPKENGIESMITLGRKLLRVSQENKQK